MRKSLGLALLLVTGTGGPVFAQETGAGGGGPLTVDGGLVIWTLVVFVIWGCIAINLAQPFILILLGAFVAGLMMAIYGVQVWYVNRKFLPRELQAPLWRQAALLLFSAFFGLFTLVVILQRVFGVKIG